MADHALLSASSSHRWLACTPSARLEDTFPDTTSAAAEEGTLAHAIAAERLEQFLEKGKPGKTSKALKADPLWRPIMEEYVDGYVTFVQEARNSLLAQDPFTSLYIEKQVSYDHLAPGGFGTSDVILIGGGILWVIDFKYGKGVKVSAKDNSQMKLYALGARRLYPLAEVDTVSMTIYQPRIDNIETSTVSYNAILTWGVNYVQPRAQLAYNGQGTFVAGDHCRFCKAEATCAARAKHQMEIAKYDFQDAALLTPDEIGDILARVDDLTRWAKSIKDYALRQALTAGETFDGWKLVEGRANRVITQPSVALQRLVDAGFGYDQVVDLVGLTTLEELVGKKRLQDIIGDLIKKPAGKPTLARESDKRAEYSAATEDFKE